MKDETKEDIEYRKILPLNEKPLLYGYTNFTYQQAILTNPALVDSFEKSGYDNWFYTNHIQLHCRTLNSSYNFMPLEFYCGDVLNNKEFIGCPFLHIQWINRDIIETFTNIIKYLVYMINANYYGDIILDDFYIANSRSFNKSHNLHQNLIYGYDLEKEELHLFGLSSNWHFKTTTISFDLFSKAFKDSYLINSDFYCKPIYFLKYRLLEKHYELDLNMMICFLEDYLYSRNTNKLLGYCYQAKERIYGLEIYDILFDIMMLGIEDIRILHILLQHKKCMSMRIEFLYKKGFLKDKEYINYSQVSKQLEELVQITQNLHFKYIDLRNVKLLDKIKSNLCQFKEQEKKLFSDLIISLKRHI